MKNAIVLHAAKLAALGERMREERNKKRCIRCSGQCQKIRHPKLGGTVFVVFMRCDICGHESLET